MSFRPLRACPAELVVGDLRLTPRVVVAIAGRAAGAICHLDGASGVKTSVAADHDTGTDYTQDEGRCKKDHPTSSLWRSCSRCGLWGRRLGASVDL